MGLINSILGKGAGSILGGVTSAVGGLFAGHAANKGYNAQIQAYNNRLNEIKTHLDNVYYQDPSQSAETQAAVTGAQKVLDNATQEQAGTNAVAGGTDESVALAKGQAAQQVGNIMNQAEQENEKQKETEWDNADKEDDAFTQYLASAKQAQGTAKAKAITAATGGLSSAAQNLPW